MTRILLLVAVLAQCLAGAAYTSASNCAGGCNLSAQSSWTPDPGAGNYPGKEPTNKDSIIVAPGHTVTIDANATLGANTDATVPHAFEIRATDSATYGTLQIAAGATLTLRGTDQTNHTMGLVNQYAYFKPLAGSTVLLDPASDRQSIVLNKGNFVADGTSGTPYNIYIGLTPSCYTWANQVTGASLFESSFHFDNNRLFVALDHPWISNASGTGPGRMGDSSLSFTVTPVAGSLAAPTVEVATLEDVNGDGKYWVNYDLGWIVFWGPSVTNGLDTNSTYKYLTVSRGSGIWSTQNTDFNSFISRNVFWQYLGNYTSNTSFWALDIQYKGSLGNNPGRLFEFTGNKVRNTSQFMRLNEVMGKSDGTSDVLITGNDIGAAFSNQGFNNRGYFLEIWQFNNNVGYVSFSSNSVNWRNPGINHDSCCTTPITLPGWKIRNNIGWAAGLFSDSGAATVWPDLLIDGNDLIGGYPFSGHNAVAQRIIQGAVGTPGHPVIIQNNLLRNTSRGLGYLGYTTIQDNVFHNNTHHGLHTGSDIVAPINYVSDVTVQRNVFTGAGIPYDTAGMNLGYNHNYWIDNVAVVHNTAVSPNGLLTIGDIDNGPYSTVATGVVVRDNLVASDITGQLVARDGGANRMQAYAVTEDDNNWYYGQSGSVYATGGTGPAYYRGGTFKQGGAPYNTSETRSVQGVRLWNPSYPTYPSSGHTLALTYTSAADITLKWDAGTAKQIVWPSAGTVYTVATACSEAGATAPCASRYPAGRIGWVTAQNSPAWTSTMGDAANPTAKFLVMTSGAEAGRVHYIGATQGGNQLELVPDWSSVPAPGDTFVIYGVEFLLDDGSGNTVSAGLDPRNMPANTRSDANIDITYTDRVGIDPHFLIENKNSMDVFGYTPLEFSLHLSATDGGTMGARPYPFWQRFIAGWAE